MNGSLTVAAALLLGFLASGHCMLMCGGISMALGVATAKDASGRPRRSLLLAYQLGRIFSYSVAGLLIGGIGGGLIAVLDIEHVRIALRLASAAALLLAALVMLGVLRDPGSGLGKRLWPKLAPLGRRLVPVSNLPRALAFGALWGWMPCGLVYTVLLVAALSAQPLQSAAVMAAFGLGTLPAMLATSWGAPRLLRLSSSRGLRRAAGCVLLASAVLTAAAPLLIGHLPWLQGWLPFDCAPTE
ncbi:MAG: sulfite exporter TauE/SafE family protein [Dokdonella sp.]|uniref:sulfite exporter TauE/SafE family protein n=2 Tax=Dokdonella sp. TaxID=2291710 RepID=UPI003BAE6262